MRVQTVGTSYLQEVKEFLTNADPEMIFLDLNLPLALGANLVKIVRETSSSKTVVLRPLENARLQGVA
jgi:DNA-binding response OmpR family regulator